MGLSRNHIVQPISGEGLTRDEYEAGYHLLDVGAPLWRVSVRNANRSSGSEAALNTITVSEFGRSLNIYEQASAS
jgi:hypothetical protein